MSDPGAPGIGGRARLLLGLAFLGLVAIAGLVGFVYLYGGRQAVELEPPLIRAPDGPVRVRPDEPGGMAVLNRDKLIFDSVGGAGGAEDESVERLLPAPETPLKPAPQAAQAAPAPAPVEEVVVVSASPAEPALLAAPAPLAAPEVEKQLTATVAALPPAAAGGWRVQIAAFRDRAAAESAWRLLRERFKPLVGALPHRIEVADLGDQGIYHRLQVGAFADKVEATGLCAKLKAAKQGCFLVAP